MRMNLKKHYLSSRIEFLKGMGEKILGELFLITEEGVVEQIRYTDALMQEIESSTELLKKSAYFQVNPTVNSSKEK